MICNVEEFVKEVIIGCEKKDHFSKQVYDSNAVELHDIIEKIINGIADLDRLNRVVLCDLSKYSDFAHMLKDIIMQLLNDNKLGADDTMVTLEEIVNETNEGELRYQLKCIFQEDFSVYKIHTLIILEHFENSNKYWTSSNYGWMRGLLCDTRGLSILVTSDKKVSEVSDEPVGSSPFYNIFEV